MQEHLKSGEKNKIPKKFSVSKNLLVKVYACTISGIQKFLRTLKTKHLQYFDNLRKIAGKLISTTSRRDEKLIFLLFNPFLV